jgi:hypothetical protein
LHNATGSTLFIADTGVSITSGGNYTIPEQDYLLWAASSNIVTFIGNSDITVSDGSFTLGISDAINLIKGIYPTTIKAVPYGNTSIFTSEANSVAASTLTDIITYTASTNIRLVSASVSGNNVAQYTLLLNGNVIGKKYTSFGAALNADFKLNTGLSIIAGDVLKVQVIHTRPYVGDFNAKFIMETT